MKTIYIDADFRCYTTNDGTMTSINTDFFDDKCDAFIEGYRFVPTDSTWIREDGEAFEGLMISPWKDWNELDDAQREYERQQLAEANATIAELDAALLDMTYQTITQEGEE